MKIHHKIYIVLIFICNLTFAQNSQWVEIKEDCFQKILIENSEDLLKGSDSLTFSIFEVVENDNKINDSKKDEFLFSGVKTSFEDLKLNFGFIKCIPELKKNSEYLVKYEPQKIENYTYHIFLLDSITKKNLDDLRNYLKESFELKKLEYTSKEKATKEAKEELGISFDDILKENIFPASFEIESKTKLNLEKLHKKFKSSIDEIKSGETMIKSFTFKITTE
jgi:hypothetical protein